MQLYYYSRLAELGTVARYTRQLMHKMCVLMHRVHRKFSAVAVKTNSPFFLGITALGIKTFAGILKAQKGDN